MSENKTPRELADLYCKDFNPHDYGIGEIAELLHSTYLVAMKAGARMGYVEGYEEGQISDGGFYPEDSFTEWWASLEGNK